MLRRGGGADADVRKEYDVPADPGSESVNDSHRFDISSVCALNFIHRLTLDDLGMSNKRVTRLSVVGIYG